MNKIILLITVLSYSIIASQPFMYLLALKYTQLNLSANSYVETRKLIDIAMRNNFRYVLYLAVFANLALLIANIKHPGSILFISSSISILALVAEVILTLKGSLPINDIINSWPANNIPNDWTKYRADWFRIFSYRTYITVTGFLSILIGVIWHK